MYRSCKFGSLLIVFILCYVGMECGHLELPAGMRRRLLDGEQDDHYGALYELSCTDKLTALTGSPRAYCNSSGMWFLEPGTCESKYR